MPRGELFYFLWVCDCIQNVATAGLTTAEIAKFKVYGNYGASVAVDQSHSEYFVITASGIPDHPTQVVNPNTATNQNYNIKIPKTPTISTTKACVPFGKIAITRTGVAIYNPLAGGSVNAVEGANAETFDSCDGHSSPDGAYHYHKIPDSCLYNNTDDEFIGVAFDGFPIYGPKASDLGRNVIPSDLDSCHGRVVNGEYRYHVTDNFPYFLGCYHGEVYSDVVTVTYTCDFTNNAWASDWTYYLCECPEVRGGGSGTGQCNVFPPPQGCPPPPRNYSQTASNSFHILYLLVSFAFAMIRVV